VLCAAESSVAQLIRAQSNVATVVVAKIVATDLFSKRFIFLRFLKVVNEVFPKIARFNCVYSRFRVPQTAWNDSCFDST
jgi:hypothetical protein